MKKVLKRTGKNLRDTRGPVEGYSPFPALPAADGGLIEVQGPGKKDLTHRALIRSKPGVIGLNALVER